MPAVYIAKGVEWLLRGARVWSKMEMVPIASREGPFKGNSLAGSDTSTSYFYLSSAREQECICLTQQSNCSQGARRIPVSFHKGAVRLFFGAAVC